MQDGQNPLMTMQFLAGYKRNPSLVNDVGVVTWCALGENKIKFFKMNLFHEIVPILLVNKLILILFAVFRRSIVCLLRYLVSDNSLFPAICWLKLSRWATALLDFCEPSNQRFQGLRYKLLLLREPLP